MLDELAAMADDLASAIAY